MANEQEEIQKTLADLQKRAEEFQTGGSYSGGNYTSGASSSSSTGKKVVLIVVIVLLIGLAIFLVIKSGGKKANYKAPKGYEVVYPKNAPPRLEKMK